MSAAIKSNLDLMVENAKLLKAMEYLRQMNMRLAVENNNLRHLAGQRMMRVTSTGYLNEWEEQQGEQ
jgi:hypothetical protein